jgi:molybdenum-dependent DNA-binding transcriptional regulator ModE
MPVINICDTVKAKGSIRAAARELGCSRAYIYKVLQANGINPSDIERGVGGGKQSLAKTLPERGCSTLIEMSAKINLQEENNGW